MLGWKMQAPSMDETGLGAEFIYPKEKPRVESRMYAAGVIGSRKGAVACRSHTSNKSCRDKHRKRRQDFRRNPTADTD